MVNYKTALLAPLSPINKNANILSAFLENRTLYTETFFIELVISKIQTYSENLKVIFNNFIYSSAAI